MRLILIIILLFSSGLISGQSFKIDSFFLESNNKGKISGIILDNETKSEPLAFATITVKNTDFETNSDLNGSFSFNLKPGNYILEVQFLGYETIELCDIAVVAGNTLSIKQKVSALKLNADISLTN
ncbi:carboxypeptidase-like regulatory domain-containing protein [Lutibacter sp.]|uniref:carboxypeptidase-like regulatory domain-containing protein n=1 Tax=Lutibacter sp. TaxID=1925666 RepID=UPI00273428A1|nr:carboxypeptidase-like regulatory domain-containing protein [Lutibacter sp.]MDP3313171.1 carboxypeptidase-like regulatory domain-containing protein [Lutibacter sp.]